jgi:hypothetical protein
MSTGTTSFDLKGSNLKSSTKVGEDGRLQLDLRFAKFLPDLPPGASPLPPEFKISASLTSLDLCRLCKRRCRALRREGARAQAWLQQVGRRRPEPFDPDHDRRLPGCVLRSRFISFWLIVDHVAILCASARRRPGETVRPCSALTRQEELTFCFLFAPTLAAIPRSGPRTHRPWPSRPDRHSWRVCRLGPLDRQRPDRVF